MISPEKWRRLRHKMAELGILEHALVEHFIRGFGSGGQKINKTASCVMLKHPPSAIVIKCQKTRSREDNRFYARRRLCEQLEERLLGEESAKQQALEKIRRQKRKRSKRAKEKMLANKAHQSTKKQQRKIVE